MTESFSYHVEMSKEKEEPGCLLLEMSPPAPRQPVRAVHAEGPLEVLGEDEKHSFLMKYTVFSGAIPLQSQAGVKVQSCLKRAAKPCCSAHAF